MTNFNFQNIKRGKYTSILGFILIVAGLLSKFLFQESWMDSMIPVAAGAVLLFAKDPKKPGSTLALSVLFLLLLFSSCTTYQKCADKFGYQDTTYIQVKDTLYRDIKVKPIDSKYSFNLRLDSLLWAKPGGVKYYYNADSTQKVTTRKDSKNDRIYIDTECLPDTVRINVAIPYEVEVPCPQTVLEDKPAGLKKKLLSHYTNFAIWAFPVCLVIILVSLRLRR